MTIGAAGACIAHRLETVAVGATIGAAVAARYAVIHHAGCIARTVLKHLPVFFTKNIGRALGRRP